MSDWKTVTLDEVLKLQRGHDLPTPERVRGDVPVVGSFGVTGWHNEARYEGPGVAIGRSGASIGTATFVKEPYWPLNTCLFVRDFKENDPRWVFRLLDGTDFVAYNSGSAQPSLNRNFLSGIPVQLPPLEEQRAIAEVLGALDDKIAANRAVTVAALELADAVFRARQVSAAGRATLGSLATTVLGGTPSRARPEFWSGTIPWLNSGKANETRILQPSEFITEQGLQQSATKLMPVRSTVIAITGATLGQVARLEIAACGNQSLVGIWSEDCALNDWLYFAIRHSIDDLLKGATGAAQQHVNKKDVDGLEVPCIDQDHLSSWFAAARPLLERAAQADRENEQLAATRDGLLPLLMSGKLRVKDAQKQVGEVV